MVTVTTNAPSRYTRNKRVRNRERERERERKIKEDKSRGVPLTDKQKLPVLCLQSESIAGASMLATVCLVEWVNISKSRA
jgi:hypothetical protein